MSREERSGRRTTRERMLARNELPRQDAPGVYVGAVIGVRIAGHLLRRHVRGSPDRGAGLRECDSNGFILRSRRSQGFRNPEIRDDGRATRQQDVLGLDITMHDPFAVRERERSSDVAQNVHCTRAPA